VRTRRRSRRRPYSPWLISRGVRNIAGILCSRPVGPLFRSRRGRSCGAGAAELAPRSTAFSHLGASAYAYFIEPLPGGPSPACPPSRDPSPHGQRIPRRRARPTPRPLHATRHLTSQLRRSLHAVKSPHGTASENLGASRKPPPAFSAPGPPRAPINLSPPRTSLLWILRVRPLRRRASLTRASTRELQLVFELREVFGQRESRIALPTRNLPISLAVVPYYTGGRMRRNPSRSQNLKCMSCRENLGLGVPVESLVLLSALHFRMDPSMRFFEL